MYDEYSSRLLTALIGGLIANGSLSKGDRMFRALGCPRATVSEDGGD